MSGEDYLLSLLSKKPHSDYAETTFINQRVCPFVKYYKDKLSVKYVGKGLLHSDITSVQSNKPADRDTLIYYYEVRINEIGNRGDICVGLADGSFPLSKHPGLTKKSFGYKSDGRIYHAKQPSDLVMPKFQTGSIIGCGINYLAKEVFFTFNGQYYGPAFRDVDLLEYYATVSLHSLNENITFNFGAKPFMFDLEQMILEEKREEIQNILSQPINHYSLHQVVHSYLNFHGYANTLEAFEKAAQMERQDIGLPRKHVLEEVEDKKKELIIDEEFEDNFKNLHHNELKDAKEIEIELKKERKHSINLEERFRSSSFKLEFESPMYQPLLMRDSSIDLEGFLLNENSHHNENIPLLKKASTLLEFSNGQQAHENNNKMIPEKSSKHNNYLLYERASLREIILEGKIADAISYIDKLFKNFVEENKILGKTLAIQQFIEYIREKDVVKAIQHSQTKLTQFQNESVYSLSNKGIMKEVPIDTIMALLCYPEPEKSELAYLLSQEHRDMTADIVNREILKKMGFIDRSILEILIAQLTIVEEKYRDNNSQYGEVFEFRV